MTPLALNREVREILVDVEERGARDVCFQVELPTPAGSPKLPPAVDELVRHRVIVTNGTLCGVYG
jgi:hypothetical protein